MSDSNKPQQQPKKRYWAFVGYPESLPADWKDRLQATGLEIAISPLHDKDIDPTGIPKKPHYHVILCFGGPTTRANVETITKELNAPAPIPLEAVKGYYRYFTHMDNPEKYQYDERGISTINGFAITKFAELSKGEILDIKKAIHSLIRTQRISEYCELMDYLLDHEMWIEYDVASNHTIYFDRLISSRRHSQPQQPTVATVMAAAVESGAKVSIDKAGGYSIQAPDAPLYMSDEDRILGI